MGNRAVGYENSKKLIFEHVYYTMQQYNIATIKTKWRFEGGLGEALRIIADPYFKIFLFMEDLYNGKMYSAK
jgi:hypothetical protein